MAGACRRRSVAGRHGFQRRHSRDGGIGLGAGVVTSAVGRGGRSRGLVGSAGYHVPIIYRSIEKSNPRLAPAAVGRGPGRPRATSAEPPTDTREAILDVAAELFANKGYAATGTREIAALVGLRQASLFHYFARKEDLFAELLDRTVSPALVGDGVADEQSGKTRSAALCARTSRRHEPVRNPSQSRRVATAPQRLEIRASPNFRAKRAQLRGRYRSLIKQTARGGRVVDLPAEMATDLVFGAVEATMTWSEGSRRGSPTRIAGAVAAAAVRGILVKPPSADDLHAAASRLRHSS